LVVLVPFEVFIYPGNGSLECSEASLVMSRLLGPLLLICGAGGGFLSETGDEDVVGGDWFGDRGCGGEGSEHYSDSGRGHNCTERKGWRLGTWMVPSIAALRWL